MDESTRQNDSRYLPNFIHLKVSIVVGILLGVPLFHRHGLAANRSRLRKNTCGQLESDILTHTFSVCLVIIALLFTIERDA